MVCFPYMFSVHMWKTYRLNRDIHIEPALFLMLFSISFGQSEESSNEVNCFLAHLSRRLIGELIVYQWSGVRRRRPPSVRRPLSTMLKHLLRNRWADQSQILCGASLGRGNDILFAASGSHDQDGRHARTGGPIFTKLGM